MPTQLTDLVVDEISGVDHPANLLEGWLVMKSRDSVDDPITQSVLAAVTNEEKGVEVAEATETEAVDTEVAKALEGVQKELADVRKELEDARDKNEQLQEAAAVQKAQERVELWGAVPGMTDDFVPVLRAMQVALPEETVEALTAVLDACQIALAEKEDEVTKEIGTAASNDDVSAEDSLLATAKSMVEKGDAANLMEALAIVPTVRPDLYTDYRGA